MSLRTKLLLTFTLLLAMALGGNYFVVAVRARKAFLDESKAKALALSDLLAAGSKFAGQLPEKAENLIGQQMIVEATLAAHLVDVAENYAHFSQEEIRARLKDVASRTVIGEFWITDEKGHAYLRNREEIDFTFPSEPTSRNQAYEFWPLLERKGAQVVQRSMPREYDGKVFKYAGVSGVDRPRIVQVGYRADSLAKLTAGMTLSDLARSVVGTAGILRMQMVQRDGQVLLDVRPEGASEKGGHIADPALLDEIRKALTSGGSRTYVRGNTLFVAAPVSSGDRGSTLLVSFDAGRTNAIIREAMAYIGAVAVALLLLGVILSFRFSQAIAAPIQRLAAEAAEIGRGNLDRRIEVKAGGEVGALSRAFNDMVTSLERHVEKLRRATAAKQKLESEIRIAAEVQSAMLPRRLPRMPGLEAFASTEAARVVGGDFYDFIELPDGRLGFAVGDASGKGLSAALLASQSVSIMRTLALDALSAAYLLNQGNRVILKTGEAEGLFVTLFYGIYDPAERTVAFANAGHPAPILLRSGQVTRTLNGEGVAPLGVMSDFAAVERKEGLEVGDLLILYTDGVTEARNPRGHLYGLSRLYESLERSRDLSPDEIVQSVRASVREFTGPREPSDDLTVVAMRLVG